jgi:transcriptional regulator with GAF, ATPase, and Fis domain
MITKDDERLLQYIQRIHEETQRFALELLTENEKLRSLVAALQNEKLQVQHQLFEIESENKHFSTKYIELEHHNFNLLNLYVASYRLHATLDRKEVLSTIQEIIINMVGSEELAVFELDPKASVLNLVAYCGISPEHWQRVPLGSGIIGRVALTGTMYLADKMKDDDDDNGRPEEAHLTACIPLKVDGRTTGAIAIFRLLEQKSSLQEVDHELFDLLATHAATALYCTSLRSEIGTIAESSSGA